MKVMSKYATMWEGRLGNIIKAKNLININPSDAPSIHATL